MSIEKLLLVGVAATFLGVACGGGTESTTGGGGEGGFITGAGGSTSSSGNGSSTSSSSLSSSSSVGAGGEGAGSVGGAGGSPPTCTDIGLGEPNQSEGSAWKLKGDPIDDCDGDGGSITGTLAPGDVDWFYYQGNDALCVVDPTRSLSQSQGGARLCKYAECVSGTLTVDCPSGTTTDTSPEGRSGCCGSSGFDIDVNCAGTIDDDTLIYIRIDQPGGGAEVCNDYTLAYHY